MNLTPLTLSASEALEKLKLGNENYLTAKANPADILPDIRRKTYTEGQNSYAVIITCADSRVIPDHIFCAGIGDLFVIRVAGNIVGDIELGSIEYAVSHLKTPLILVMGHTHCGAINAALQKADEGYAKFVTDEIALAIGDEHNDEPASKLNKLHTADKIRKALYDKYSNVTVVSAIYRTDSGKVDFI